jgi:hypothetical protein
MQRGVGSEVSHKFAAVLCFVGVDDHEMPPAFAIRVVSVRVETGGLFVRRNDIFSSIYDRSDCVAILVRRLDGQTPSQAVALELDPMSIMNDAIKNGVGDCWIADQGVRHLFSNGWSRKSLL